MCGKIIGHLFHIVALLVAIASLASSKWVIDSQGGSLGLWNVCGSSNQCFSVGATNCNIAGNVTVGGITYVSALPACNTLLAMRIFSVISVLFGGAHAVALVAQLLTVTVWEIFFHVVAFLAGLLKLMSIATFAQSYKGDFGGINYAAGFNLGIVVVVLHWTGILIHTTFDRVMDWAFKGCC